MPNNPLSRLGPDVGPASPSQRIKPDPDPRHGSRLSTSPTLPGAGPTIQLGREVEQQAVPPRPAPVAGETPVPPELRPHGAGGGQPGSSLFKLPR